MFKIYGKTDLGIVRSVNEDAFFYSASPVGIFDALLAVCDGMGGHSYGEVASSLCIRTAVEDIAEEPLDMPSVILDQAVSAANLAVRKESEKRRCYEMGTTLVLAGISGSRVFAANVGDSRLYLIDGNDQTITQVTKDHSYVEEQVERGLLERGSYEYNCQKNMITRAIGVYAEVEADQFSFELRDNQYLLLCSDGLSNMVPDTVIKNLVLDDLFDLKRRVESLIRAANSAGGTDNITAVLARYTEE